jgi:tetratricopeptide (TPR) repeat protein
LRVATGAFYISQRDPDLFGLGVNPEKQPVNAARFLVENHLDGRILNHLGSGGWLDWRGPQKVFIDGRLEVMGEDFYSEYRTSFKRGGLAPLLSKYGIQILFFNPDSAPTWLFQLAEMPEWRPVYLDESAVIYLRSGYAPQLPALDDAKVLEGIGVVPSTPQQAQDLLRAPSPSPWACFWDDFYETAPHPMALNTIGDYYSFTGRLDLAESVYLENLRRTEGRYWDMYYNLGTLYQRAGRLPEARLCMERVLEIDPSIGKAKKILAETN